MQTMTTDDRQPMTMTTLIALPLAHARGVISVPRESDWPVLVAMMIYHLPTWSLEKSRTRNRSTTWCGLSYATVYVGIEDNGTSQAGLEDVIWKHLLKLSTP